MAEDNTALLAAIRTVVQEEVSGAEHRLGGRIDGVDARLGTVEDTVSRLDARLGTVEEKTDQLQHDVLATRVTGSPA